MLIYDRYKYSGYVFGLLYSHMLYSMYNGGYSYCVKKGYSLDYVTE